MSEVLNFSKPKKIKLENSIKLLKKLESQHLFGFMFQLKMKMKRKEKAKIPKSFNYFYLISLNFGFFVVICLLLTPTCEGRSIGSRNRLMFANNGLRNSPVTNPEPNPIPAHNYEVPSFATYLYHNRHVNVKRHPSGNNGPRPSNNNVNTNTNTNTNANNDVYSVGDIQAMTDDVMAQHPKPNPYPDNQENTDDGESLQEKIINTCQTVCACKWKGGKQTVECIDNQLIQIPTNIDPSTQVLDMSGNKLQTLGNEQFVKVNLLNLQKLYLRNCKIGEIEPETFKGLTNLVELDLSHNLLVVVPSFAFSFVASLRELTLSSNHIHKVEMNAFANMPALNKLDISHCDIQFIAPRAFGGLPALNSLRLNGNKLGELLPKTIENLDSLHAIELHDNPWVCDCRLRDTKLWLAKKNIPIPVAPVCSGGPERNLDKTFEQLQIDDFACKPEMLPINHYVEAITGENASITCRVKAVPTAQISWFWNGRLLHNNSAFSSFQRIFIFEEGKFEKRSRLILTNAQESDSSDFYCVAENKAGSAEANFTLHVSMRAVGMAALGSAQIIALSAALVALIIGILVFIFFMIVKMKRRNYGDSKTPNHLEVITTVNHSNAILNKAQPPSVHSSIVIANGAVPNCIDGTDNLERKGSVNNMINETIFTNPVQKPPRLTDLPYNANNFESPACVLATGPSYLSPTASAGNNPDLINDTKRYGSDEFVDLKIPPILTAALGPEHGGNSGEYSRAGCDSLYPSGLWEHAPAGTATSADDLFMKRYNDKSPIMENTQLFDLHERSDFFSKTFPRTHYSNLPSASGATGILPNQPSTSSAALIRQGGFSNASTATTNLSTNSSTAGAVGGYPNDYGLPLVPGAEHQHNHHLQMHPLQQLQHQLNNTLKHAQQQQQQQQQQQFGSANNSPNFNSRPLSRFNDANQAGTSSRTSPLASARPMNKFIHGAASTSSAAAAAAAAAAAGMNPLATPSTSTGAASGSSSILPNGQPVNAKTIRVWQKGGVPVLPPVSALKRALISSSRNSPDEGYQEGCGTDV